MLYPQMQHFTIILTDSLAVYGTFAIKLCVVCSCKLLNPQPHKFYGYKQQQQQFFVITEPDRAEDCDHCLDCEIQLWFISSLFAVNHYVESLIHGIHIVSPMWSPGPAPFPSWRS